MTTQDALDIKTALIILEKHLNVPASKLGSLINLYDEDSYKKLREASIEWNKFDDADIVERGKMLGYEVTLKEK